MGCLPLLPSDWPHSSPCPPRTGAWEHAAPNSKCLSWQVESVNKPLGEGNRSEAPSRKWSRLETQGGGGDFSITGGIKAGARLCAGMPRGAGSKQVMDNGYMID